MLVGDDHPMIREAIRRRLQAVPDFDFVGEAENADAVLELVEAEEGRVDVAVLDIHMPPGDGLETTQIIRQRYPQVEVILLTGTAEPNVVVEGLRRGAKGYLLKHRDSQQLTNAVRLVARGTVLIDPDLVEQVAGSTGPVARPDDALTAREVELLQLVASGRRNSDIAKVLFVSEGTVKSDLSSILAKLGANDRTSAVAEAFRRGLIE